MEPFRLDRQAKVFLAVLIVVALAMVPLAPFLALVFAGLSLVVLCLVFLIALARNRRPFGPLTRTEGVLALCATVFAIGGALVIAYATVMLGAGNATMLGQAMLPFRSAETREGKEYVKWSQEHDAAAEAISVRLRDGPFPQSGRTHFQDPQVQKAFAAWLGEFMASRAAPPCPRKQQSC